MFGHHSKTYYKYLASYGALLLTAIIALVFVSQVFFIRQLRTNLEDNHRALVQQSVQEMDSDLQQIYDIEYQISTVNQNFFSYYLEAPSPVRDLRLVNEFKNLLAPSTLISEIALADADAKMVYTSTAVYSAALFFDRIFSFPEGDPVASSLADSSRRIIRTAQRSGSAERYLAFINTPSVFSRLQNSVLIFFVQERHFLSFLSPESTPSRQGAILDSSGQVVVSTMALDAPLTDGISTIRLHGTNYLIYREPSSVLNWTYYFFLPASETLAPLYRAQAMLALFLLVVLAAGTLVIHYAMKVNYRPIQELTESLGRSDADDLESLKDAIASLAEQNNHMRSQLMTSPDGQALKDSLLFSLLKGKFDSFASYNIEAEALGMSFTKPCYQVLMLRAFNQDTAIPRQTLSAIFAECFGDDFTWQFRELFEHSMFVCLVGMEADEESKLADCCRRLLDISSEKYNLVFSIGMSNCYTDVAHLSTACFEATQAVKEHFIRGQHQLIPYHELTRTLDVPSSDRLALLNDLPAQTPQQQMQTIRRFIDGLKADCVPSLLAKSYCNSAVQLLMAGGARQVNMDDLFTITYLRTVDDYLAFMLHLLEPDPKALVPDTAESGAPVTELLQRIYTCIADSYDDCSFSLQDVAAKLDLSSGYLSQYFKQQTGDTLTSYVADLRIRKACSLLESTTMPLQMVSESVGYYNLNSFIRRFKQITGLTPGEYRKTRQSSRRLP